MAQNLKQSSTTKALEQGGYHKDSRVSEFSSTKKIAPSSTLTLTEKDFLSSGFKRPLSDTSWNSILEGPFGFGSLIYPSLQRFNNINFFLTMYCVLALAQGVIFGLSDLCIGQFQKAFYLTKTEKVVLAHTYDFSSLLVAILVAHYGGRGNRSKWMAAAAFLVGLGSIACGLPYFQYEIEIPMKESEEMCVEDIDRKTKSCEEVVIPNRSNFLYSFIFGQSLQGFAGMPIYILGMTFIDDHIPIYSAGLYLGIAEGAVILGYGLGFVVGAQENKPQNQTVKEIATDNNFRWWQINFWAGFLSTTLLAWSTFLPFLCFPTNLPGACALRLEKEKKHQTFDKRLKDKQFGLRLKDLCHALQCLLKSPLLMCHAMCKATESLTLIGSAEFLPKYLENQFLLTPSFSSLLTGIILVPGGAIGSCLGGLIVAKMKLSCKSHMRFVMITSAVALLLFILVFFIECETTEIAGINEDYDGTGSIGNLTAPCNERCSCLSSIYVSVCGRDEVEYYSPCYAGCKDTKLLNDERTFYNCSCIKEGLTTADVEGDFVDAFPGKCNTRCYKLPLFFAFVFSSITFSSLGSIPLIIIILRTLPTHLHSLGMGVTYTTLRLFGSIPGPLMFETAASNSCSYWDINECGKKGNCWIYDKSKMVYILMGICVVCKIATILLCFTAFLKYDVLVIENTESLDLPVMRAGKKKNIKKKRKRST